MTSSTRRSWKAMLNRVSNPKYEYYHRYGGRGISIDPSWLVYDNFVRDMGDRPLNMTLDRIDNDKNYTKDNCKWATPAQQARNRHNSVGPSAAMAMQWLVSVCGYQVKGVAKAYGRHISTVYYILEGSHYNDK